MPPWMTSWGCAVVWLLQSFFSFCLSDVMVKEVAAGSLAVLDCPSNDANHRFMRWWTPQDKAIGPGNEYNPYKYKYEVLTGTLYIKAISTSESGFYKCVSQSLSSDKRDLKSENVELIVTKDWEDVYENDAENNTFRAVAALSVVLVVLLAILFVLRMRRSRPLRFRDLIDDESQDETPAAARAEVYRPTTLPSTSGTNNSIGPPGPPSPAGKDNLAVAVDTDFPTAFEDHDRLLP